MSRNLLLDTDIGSDIDDELTLALILGSPELTLLGCTTSYGDTLLRARIAGRLAQLAGSSLVAVPGVGQPLSGREVWWAGHEGDGYPDLESVPVRTDVTGPEFLAGEIASRRGEIDLLCIAPLTTVAGAIDLGAAAGVRGLTIMCGDFAADPEPEHNIVSDVIAAQTVFSADCPVTVVGVEITRQVHLLEADMVALAARGRLGDLLATASRAWMRRWQEDFEIPHDPVTALTLLTPSLFTFSPPGRVQITEDGLSLFTPQDGGNIRIATSVDAQAAAAEVLQRILAGVGPRP